MNNELLSELWNCPSNFDVKCPTEWEKLKATNDDSVRFCNVCQQKVHLCKTPDEFVAHGNQGHCVATPKRTFPAIMSTMMMGRPSLEAVRRLECEQDTARDWWSRTLAQLPQFEHESMTRVAKLLK